MCTFARRKLDIPNDTHYLNMFYSTMVGVGYMHFCQQERPYNSANFDIKYSFSTKSRVMHLCLSTLDIFIYIYYILCIYIFYIYIYMYMQKTYFLTSLHCASYILDSIPMHTYKISSCTRTQNRINQIPLPLSVYVRYGWVQYANAKFIMHTLA